MKARIKTRKLTRQDVDFIIKLKSEGVKLCYIARYVYGINTEALRGRLKSWGAA